MKRILLVEDQHYVISQTILETFGDVEVVIVTQGHKAIEEFAKGKYDGVICDLRLPVLDGFIVLQAIKKINSSVPVLILTTSTDKPHRDRAMRLGADAYFIKPPDYIKLHNRLIELIALAERDRLFTTNPLSEEEAEKLAKYRRLWALRKQAAQMGISTPPHIAIEIEDLEEEVRHGDKAQ